MTSDAVRIFYDFQIFALQRHGGISRYFMSLWKEFQRGGQVRSELFIGLNQTDLDTDVDAYAHVEGFRAKDPIVPHTRRLAWQFNASLCERHLKRSQARVYHPTYFWLPRKLHNKILVLTVYDLIHEMFPEHFDRSDSAYRWRPEAIHRADLILAISETTKRDLCERYRIDPMKVVVTPLGCAVPLTSKRPPTTPRGRPFLLYVGDRRGYKNFSVVAEAWRHDDRLRRDFTLLCFGGADPSAEERALPGDVQFARGDDAALADAYREAAALIYPSLYEGFGLPVVEAFSLGCPVVTSGRGAIREVAADAATYFEPTSPECLTEAVMHVTADASLRSSLIARGRARALPYSWQRCAELTSAAYQSVSRASS